MQLSILIVNYKSATLVLDCLRSVYAETKGLDFEVLVIDNNSGGTDYDLIRAAFPSVKWIQMGQNAGFARANNAGIRAATAPVLLLLNPDTIIESGAIHRCYDKFMEDDSIACGVQLLNADRSPQISGNYFVKGGLNFLLPLPVTGWILKQLGLLVGAKKPHVPEATDRVEVDWINGAFLMLKKKVVDQAGLLDEDFFLYYEEVEWCSRLKNQGSLCIYGDLHVLHLQGETANTAFQSSGKGYYNFYDRKGFQFMSSGLLRIRKQYGRAWLLFHLAVFTLSIPLAIGRYGWYLLVHPADAGKEWRQTAGFIGNSIRLWGLLGKLWKNRPYFYKFL